MRKRKHPKIGIGIIGFGRGAEIFHLPLINKLKTAKLIAVCDVTTERRNAASAFGLETYKRLNTFLQNEEIQAIVVTTPTSMHYEHTMQSLRAGKHVIVDKPAALNAKEFKHMIAEAKRNSRVLTVFQNRRFDSDVLTIKKFLQTGRLGRIFSIQRRILNWGSMWQFGVEEYYQNWRNENKFGGGALYDWGSHIVDQLLFLKNNEIHKVSAVLQNGITAKDCDDLFISLINFKDGTNALLEVNYVTKYKIPNWIICAQNGTLISDLYNSNDIKVFFNNKNIEKHLKPIASDYITIYSSFINKIKGRGELAVTPESVLGNIQLMDRIRQSANFLS